MMVWIVVGVGSCAAVLSVGWMAVNRILGSIGRQVSELYAEAPMD